MRNDIEIDAPSDAAVAEFATSLGRSVSDTNGVAIVDFYVADGTGGESAALDVNSDG